MPPKFEIKQPKLLLVEGADAWVISQNNIYKYYVTCIFS